TRFIGDTRRTTGGALPQYLSESSFIFGVGLASRYWHGIMAWGEAGSAVSYLGRHPGVGHMVPDYRGGIAYAKAFGHTITHKSPGLFFETSADAVFVSRFGDDVLFYSQNKVGYTPRALEGLQTQLYWHSNITADTGRQTWANFAEFGPGVRFRAPSMPRSLLLSVNFVRGVYTQSPPRRPFYD